MCGLIPPFIKSQKTYYTVVVSFVILFSLFCVFQLFQLRFNYDFEAFFPNEDHELELYDQYRKTFEYDNEFCLIGIERKAGIFDSVFLKKVDSISRLFAEVPDIEKVNSPTNLKLISYNGLSPVAERVLHFENPSLYKDDSTKIYNSDNLIGSFFPEDGKSVSVFLRTKERLTKTASDSLANRLERIIGQFQFDDIHYVGRIFAQNVYLNNLKTEFVLFLLLSLTVVVIFLWFSFKSVYGIIVPLSIVVISILWTLGVMALLGKDVDLMCAMLPTMIFIAGMSDVVHFFSKYFEELAKGTERGKIYPLILKEVGFPTFLTLVTTVVGFLSLLFSSIKPIRDFGIYTSIGVVIAFILSYTLLPALLYFFTPKKLVSVHGHNNKTYAVMRSGLFWIFRNQKFILGLTSVVVILSAIGIYKIRVNNILLEDLSDKVKIKQDFNFFDKHYSGVRPLELAIFSKDGKTPLWNYELMRQIYRVDTFVRKEYGACFSVSPALLVKTIYHNSYDVPDKKAFPDKEEYNEIVKLLQANRNNRDIQVLMTKDALKSRSSTKIRDMGSLEASKHNAALMQFIKTVTDTSQLEFKITGAAHLIDRNNEYMVDNMIQGFGFSILVIALLTYLLHRSWRMVLVFILPNVIPLIIIAGIMGFAGIELKAATSLVFSIAFGIATDDTIHFISRLKIELEYGKSLLYAFKRTYFETGKPIILTTFILMGGFMSLMISDFQSTFYFGFLVCITVIIAVLADIFLLPVLLFLIYGKTKK
ncbi:MAG: MMPL family transporter [Sediminibacterium sp.]|nr:MMPL family transporter [Sediminibacterium sp.]